MRHWADRPDYIRRGLEDCEGRAPEHSRMPGHIKKTSGPDPDPSPWLVVSEALKAKNKAKPYDTKKSVWVGALPD